MNWDLSAPTAGIKLTLARGSRSSLPQQAATASPAARSSVGALALAFIAGLCHADPHAHLSRTLMAVSTCARWFGELIGFCSGYGITGCAVIANVSICGFFRVKLFFTDAGSGAVGDGNTGNS